MLPKQPLPYVQPHLPTYTHNIVLLFIHIAMLEDYSRAGFFVSIKEPHEFMRHQKEWTCFVSGLYLFIYVFYQNVIQMEG